MIGRRFGRSSFGRMALALALGCLCSFVVAPETAAQYLGSEECAECHLQKYNDFRLSGHPYKLIPSAEARTRPIPLPEGYRWDDVAYVIGGFKWKARFIGNDGYIITSLKDGTPGMNQYNFFTRRWVDYNAGDQKPYDCGRCHTTGFSPSGNQDGRPGILGTWAFGGIQCEACHGAGFALHGEPEHIDRSAAACGQCHVRGDPDTIPASGGFIRHHEQYNEHRAGPHESFACVDCHDPHKPSESSIHTTCRDCHANIAAAYEGSIMDRWNVDCIDCHMPFASKSADALGPFRGDVRTHLFEIDTRADAQLFTADGNFVQLDGAGRARLTVDFACLSCHLTESRQWAAFYSRDFHGPSNDDRVVRPQRPRIRTGIFR